MKTSSFLSIVIALAGVTAVQAAPSISVKDVSVEALKAIASPAQAASIKAYEEAKAAAEARRAKAIKEAKDVTADNDAGMKKTIIKRTLNNMLPACERSAEAPRVPSNYEVVR